jgi:diacylglycerol kinase (ATP)
VFSGLLDGKHQTPLAILAAGTVNDFAYAMQLPRSDSAVAKMIRQGKTRLIDVGQANDRYFVNVAAGGLLTDVAYKVPTDAKTVLGTLAYVIEAQGIFPPRHCARSGPYRDTRPIIDEEILLFIVSNTSSVAVSATSPPRLL